MAECVGQRTIFLPTNCSLMKLVKAVPTFLYKQGFDASSYDEGIMSYQA